MIIELWVGEERECNHRCELHFGECKLTWLEQLAAAQVSSGCDHPHDAFLWFSLTLTCSLWHHQRRMMSDRE